MRVREVVRWCRAAVAVAPLALAACGSTEPCVAGEYDVQSCGECMVHSRICLGDGAWSDWGYCVPESECAPDAAPACLAGERQQRACGACGIQVATCEQGAWSDWGACVERNPGETTVGTCGTCGSRTAICEDGQWVWGECVEPAMCVPCTTGLLEEQVCGSCGRQTRACVAGAWQPWSDCVEDSAPECTPDAIDTVACGTDQGACTAGTSTRTCQASCSWSGWSECSGSYVGPAVETCGNSTDDDCDGAVDEGCDCNPAPPGASGVLTGVGDLARVVADPGRCRLYGVTAPPSNLVVVDTRGKAIVTTLPLAATARDLAISGNGDHVVVGHGAEQMVSILAADTLALTLRGLGQDAAAVAVRSDGEVFTTAGISGAGSLARFTVPNGPVTFSGPAVLQKQALALRGTSHLYTGGGATSHLLYEYNVSGAGFGWVRAAPDPESFLGGGSSRFVYVSPSGNHVYYNGQQLVPSDLLPRGDVGFAFAEDQHDAFVVTPYQVFDADTLLPVADLPAPTPFGALTAVDSELWLIDTDSLRYQSIADLFDVATLGRRTLTPLPLADYQVHTLVHDPIRPRLYGLDIDRGSLVVIDPRTSSVVADIPVGSGPFQMSIDPAGDYLYVAMLISARIARISLRDLRFDGLLPTPLTNYYVVALADGVVATVNFKTGRLQVVAADGTTLQTLSLGSYTAIGRDATGRLLFTSTSSNLIRYRLTASGLVEEDRFTGLSLSGNLPVPVGDGARVFFTRQLRNGLHLAELQYEINDGPVLMATAEGRLAITGYHIYRVSDGANLGAMPYFDIDDEGNPTNNVMAVSPDGSTLYVLSGGQLHRIDLTQY